MPGQAIDAAQEMTKVRDQGPSAQMQIGHHHEPKLLQQSAPAAVIGQDAGVQHFRGGEDEMGHSLPDGTALGNRGVTIIGGDGQLVIGQELVIAL